MENKLETMKRWTTHRCWSGKEWTSPTSSSLLLFFYTWHSKEKWIAFFLFKKFSSPHPPASWYRAEAGIKSRKILILCPWCWQTPLPFYNSADCLMGCIHLSLLSSLWQSISKDLTSPHTYFNFLLLVSCRKWSHRHQQNSSGLKIYSFLSTQGLYRLWIQLLQLAFQLHLFSALQDQAFGWSSGSKYSSKWLMRAH